MNDDPARARFMIIQVVRIAGVVMALCGMAIIAGKIALPQEVGYVLFLVGLIDAMLVPTVLTRRWKSPGA